MSYPASSMKLKEVSHCDPCYPEVLLQRLDPRTAPILTALGNLDLLALHKTALFCSSRCPGNVILRAYDQARHWRDSGYCVVSGFHSSVEKECLRILLRGNQPIIICLARAISKVRIRTEWSVAFDTGRLLYLSPFTDKPKRVTKDAAWRRNEVVAALADSAYIAHASPGGQTARIADMLEHWHVPITSNVEKK